MGVSSLVDGFAHLEGLVARLLDAVGRTLTLAERERLVDAAWEAEGGRQPKIPAGIAGIAGIA